MSILEAYCEYFGIDRADLPPMKDKTEEELANVISQTLGMTPGIADSWRYQPYRVLKIIADHFDISPEILKLPTRMTNIRQARQLYFYMMFEINRPSSFHVKKDLVGKPLNFTSLEKIGKFLICEHNPYGFSHCTVMHGHKAVCNLRDTEREMRDNVIAIWNKI